MADVNDYKRKGMSERDAVMAQLVDMKRDKKDEKKGSAVASVGPDEPYPYGLSISLEDESLKKLGITEMPKPGDVMKIMAQATVESVSQHSSSEHGDDKSLRLQITKMHVCDSDEEVEAE